MAHDHHHDHNAGSYYVEQLCAIGVCGALGGVAVILWYRDFMEPDRHLYFLHPSFRLPLMLGGAVLLLLALIRAIAVWVESGKRTAHVHHHDHDHGHDHSHDHHEHGPECEHHHHEHGPGCDHHHEHTHDSAVAAGHTHAHGHDHDHDHGWGPWRYTLLLFPIMLFFLQLPPVEAARAVGSGNEVSFRELTGAADNPDKRDYFEGKTIELKAQVEPSGDDRQFRLMRLHITCCGADALPLKIPVFIDATKATSQEKFSTSTLAMKWVRVRGQIHFQSRTVGDKKEWAILLVVRPDEKTPLRELIVELGPTERPPAFEYAAAFPVPSKADMAEA